MSVVCPICEFSDFAPVICVPDAQLFQLVPRGKLPEDSDFSPLRISRCLDCGHVFHAEFDDRLGDRMYRGDVVSNFPVDVSMTRNLEAIVEWIGRENYSSKTVLEVGAGSGHVARLLAKLAKSVDVFEPSAGVRSELIPEANIRWSRDIFRGSGAHRYDLAICRQVLEHVRDPFTLLWSIAEALPFGGALYLEVPNLGYIEDRGAVFDLHLAHVHYFDRMRLERLCTRAGFACERVWELKEGHDLGLFLRKTLPNLGEMAPSPVPPARPNLSTILNSRLLKVREEVRDLGTKTALYGATWQGLSFLSQVESDANFVCVYDDNSAFWEKAFYSRQQLLRVRAPGPAAWEGIENIIITAYLHQQVIVDKLRYLGFKGSIWSIGSPTASHGLSAFQG